eukprot:366029-Chlamydomonas_euryale.AAC.37
MCLGLRPGRRTPSQPVGSERIVLRSSDVLLGGCLTLAICIGLACNGRTGADGCCFEPRVGLFGYGALARRPCRFPSSHAQRDAAEDV